MKILYTGRFFHPSVGGTEKLMLEFGRRLIQNGHEVGVLTLNKNLNTGEKFASYEEYEGIKIYRVPFANLGLKPMVLASPSALFKIFNEYDLIHSHDVRFLLEATAAAKLFLKKPLVVGSYGYIFHQNKIMPLKKFVFNCYMKPFFKMADRMHVISYQDREKILGTVEPDRIHLVTGGVDFSKFSDISPNRKKGKLVCFGRLDVHKGVDLLFEALAKVKSPFELDLIYGAKNEEFEKSLRALSRERGLEGKVNWVGRVSEEELKKRISEAQLVMLPSRYEGFGVTTLEAMAVGGVPVANKIDAFENVLTHEKDGFLVDFNHSDEAARAIERYLEFNEDDLARIGKAAQQTAERYDWGHQVARLEKLYTELSKSALV